MQNQQRDSDRVELLAMRTGQRRNVAEIDMDYSVLRVPGGWIYTIVSAGGAGIGHSVFVPEPRS